MRIVTNGMEMNEPTFDGILHQEKVEKLHFHSVLQEGELVQDKLS